MSEFNPSWHEIAVYRELLRDHAARIARYKKAMHDAINLPQGVVPFSAEGLYQHDYYATSNSAPVASSDGGIKGGSD